jgi:hypothetical protein
MRIIRQKTPQDELTGHEKNDLDKGNIRKELPYTRITVDRNAGISFIYDFKISGITMRRVDRFVRNVIFAGRNIHFELAIIAGIEFRDDMKTIGSY